MWYIDGQGKVIGRLSNRSALKNTILRALFELGNGAGEPDTFSDDLKNPYFGVVTIARKIYGNTVFTDGKLDKSRRVNLNKALNALYEDRFVDKTGKPFRGFRNPDPRIRNRDVATGYWRITDIGSRFVEKTLSTAGNRVLNKWMKDHRFYGARGIKIDRSTVKHVEKAWYD